MAISNLDSSSTEETLLVNSNWEHSVAVDGFVDYKGRPVYGLSSGGWRSASFIIGVEVAERFAYYGIVSNLITYLTGPLGESTATAAENVNAWFGTGTLLPLLMAFVADSFLGRYPTILLASLIYILGLCLLTLSALLTSLTNSDCTTESCSPPKIQIILFFFSLYLVAIGQGGHKPCVQAFGADQFDGQNAQENKAKSSFFNWWYFSASVGINLSLLIVIAIQDNLNWSLGFGIPCIVMIVALLVFLLGTKTYRYNDTFKGNDLNNNNNNPFARIGRVFVAALKNRKLSTSNPLIATQEEQVLHTLLNKTSHQFKFLNKALIGTTNGLLEDGSLCSVNDVEEAKTLLRLIPIWATCLVYAIVFSQSTTFFTKQGATMDRKFLPGIVIPSASLQLFIGFAIILFMPIYDRVFVPITRSFSRNPSGITMLQRIGTGIVLSAISMVVAALIERTRLETAVQYGIVDEPNVTVPMSVWWLVPQYVLFGIADVFTIVGLQELFYDQVPKDLRSVGLSLYLGIIGVGSFLSSFLVSLIDKATSGDGKYSWFANNLNRAHLDYFYWLLAGLSALGFIAYLYFAKSYIYNKQNTTRF